LSLFLSLDVPQIKLIRRQPALGHHHHQQHQQGNIPPSRHYFQPNFTEFEQITIESNGADVAGGAQLAYIHVNEGGNVTLDCVLLAKPPVTVVRWTHNLAEIWHETEGINN